MAEHQAETQVPGDRSKVLHEAEDESVRMLSLDPRQTVNLEMPEGCAGHLVVMAGAAEIHLDGDVYRLGAGQTIDIWPKAPYRLVNAGGDLLQVIEIRHGASPGEGASLGKSPRFGHMARTSVARKKVELTPPVVVAEIGCNHKGDMDIALEMIKIAAQFCDVDVVKFQKRTNRELLSEKEYSAPHPNPAQSYGVSYGEHREFLEFDLDQHRTMMAACEEWGVVYSSSVWDVTSAREIASLEPQLIKIPSAINTDLPVLDCVFSEYPGEIHISLGMTSNAERDRLVELARSRDRLKDVVLYHCVSGYPVDDEELFLLEIRRLCEELGNEVKGIGFSGHHRGISADVAALTLGAAYFERHFTLDRTWKGTDHAASLEPDGLRRLARNLRLAYPALRYKDAEILEVEQDQRKKLKRVREL